MSDRLFAASRTDRSILAETANFIDKQRKMANRFMYLLWQTLEEAAGAPVATRRVVGELSGSGQQLDFGTQQTRALVPNRLEVIDSIVCCCGRACQQLQFELAGD